MRKNKTFHMVYLALLVAFAVALHTVEAALPLPVPVPGARLGLANIITLITLVLYCWRSALTVAVLRSVVGSLITGAFLGFGFYLSLAGAVASSLAMALVFPFYLRGKITLVSVSLAGAVVFNIVQLALAATLVQNIILFRGYLPFLLILSVPTGIFTGLLAHQLLKATTHIDLRLTAGAKRIPALRQGRR
ncbi:MAG: Gx transporter family protein [Bacillota bacterium]